MTKEEKMNLLMEDSQLLINNKNSKERRIFKIEVNNSITLEESIEQLKRSILK